MKRFVVFVLSAVLAMAASLPLHAQRPISPEENARLSQKAQKKQQKAMNKSMKQQRKAMKKSAKSQRKALEKAHQQGH
jgi:hypothetical protein